jgi:NOL1/NOP2/sun family putative RNA methylase
MKGRVKRKSNIKKVMKSRKKYFTKVDVFLSRMASIMRVPTGVAMKMFSDRAVTTIRLNTLAQEARRTLGQLKKMGAVIEEVPWLEDTYLVKNLDKSDLAVTQMYKFGFFYIQNLSSMIPAVVLDPKPDEVILDMCASPGSKTTQMAAMLKNKGSIIANELDSKRVEKLQNVLEMFNVKNTKVRQGKGEAIGSREEGHYDKVLLDAPCSGEGLIYLKGEKPLRFWNVKKVNVMSKLQKELILSAFKALKKGGTLVYSTCTLEPEENEGVITELLETQHSAKLVEIDLFNSNEFKEYKTNVKRGIVSWNDEKYSNHVSKTYRILPSGKMMAFYVAKIVKE